MTADEAAAVRELFAGHPNEAVVLGLVEDVLMWQKAAASDSIEDLRNLARVARGERQPVAPLVVDVMCECHCCQKMEASEQLARDAKRRGRARRFLAMLRGRKP